MGSDGRPRRRRYPWILLIILTVYFLSCVEPKLAQFFVFPENRSREFNNNLLRGVFPGWDIDVAIISPQADYWYNECESCMDFKYHVAFLNIHRVDFAGSQIPRIYGWKSPTSPSVSDRIGFSAVRITLLPDRESFVADIDSSLFIDHPQWYVPGLRCNTRSFSLDRSTDSLRIAFDAILMDSAGTTRDKFRIDTLVYRWDRPLQ